MQCSRVHVTMKMTWHFNGDLSQKPSLPILLHLPHHRHLRPQLSLAELTFRKQLTPLMLSLPTPLLTLVIRQLSLRAMDPLSSQMLVLLSPCLWILRLEVVMMHMALLLILWKVELRKFQGIPNLLQLEDLLGPVVRTCTALLLRWLMHLPRDARLV